MPEPAPTRGYPDSVEEFRSSARYRTGVAVIDLEHAELIGRCRALVDSLQEGRDLRRFRRAFAAMLAAARRHFRHEESLMRAVGYGGYRAHKTAHDRLLRDARDFARGIETGFGRVECSGVAKYLRYWLLGHIERHDIKLGRHIVRRGGRRARAPARESTDANEIRCQV